MTTLRMAAVAAPFDRDLEADFARVEKLICEAKAEGVRLLVLPEAALGGYLANLDGGAEGPPALAADGPELKRLAALAGDLVVTAGDCELPRGPPHKPPGCVPRAGGPRPPPQ